MENTGTVSVSLAFTRNLGDYQSIKINVGLSDDVRKTETQEEAFDRVFEFVNTKLNEKTEEVEKELASLKKVK